MTPKITKFSFMVLTYNHEKYIVEHLESIKFLILTYGKNIKFQIIINDDASSDSTIKIVDNWLLMNASIFSSVDKIYNTKNIGTCSSVVNILDRVQSEYSKLTAGDDVYSYENLFESASLLNDYEIVSGIPLYLENGSLRMWKGDLFNLLATNVVYKGQPLIDRFKGFSFNNAPNMLYSSKVFKNKDILKFVDDFDVVEDFPLQVATSIFIKNPIFHLEKKTFVYYRRTPGSIYLVASNRFVSDINKMYSYLFSLKGSFFSKALILNRKYCFSIKSGLIRKALNISIYWFYIRAIFKFNRIYKEFKIVDIVECSHKKHYLKIKYKAKNSLASMDL